MRQSKINPEVIAGFVLGLIAGGTGVGLVTVRQIEAEHQQAIKMAGAAQQSQSMARMDVIRAREAAAAAMLELHRSSEQMRRANAAAQTQLDRSAASR